MGTGQLFEMVAVLLLDMSCSTVRDGRCSVARDGSFFFV